MSPLRGNSSRGMRCVAPGKGGSRTSSPEVPLGSSGSIGGLVCIGGAPQMAGADPRTPRAQNQVATASHLRGTWLTVHIAHLRPSIRSAVALVILYCSYRHSGRRHEGQVWIREHDADSVSRAACGVRGGWRFRSTAGGTGGGEPACGAGIGSPLYGSG